MPRRQTAFISNQHYHIFNRTHLGLKIFRTEKDYDRFIEKTHQYSEKHGVKTEAFAVLDNHYHFLLKQLKNGDIRKFITSLQMSSAICHNLKHQRKGPVFEGRYKSKFIHDDDYYVTVKKYIIDNPAKRKMARLKEGISSNTPGGEKSPGSEIHPRG